MQITLTRVPISSFPSPRSHVKMFLKLNEAIMPDWANLLSTLSRGDCINIELSSLARHPFVGLKQINLETRQAVKTCSNMRGTVDPAKLSFITLRFISAQKDGASDSFADILRKSGWMIL